MKKNENNQKVKEHVNEDILPNEEEFSFTRLHSYAKSNNKISPAISSKNYKEELSTEDKKIKLLKLSDNMILNILSFLNVKEKINTIIFNRRLQILTKIKLRHIKLKKFLFELFYPDFSTEKICKFITENNNFTNILNRFKLMTEFDVIRSLSFFLTDLMEANKENNIFLTKFNSLINVEFTNKFLNIHDLNLTKLIISIDEFYSQYFYNFLNKNQILIEEMIINERSKNLEKIFNHNTYKFKINKFKFTYEDEEFNEIQGVDIVRNYFFNTKNSIRSLEVVRTKNNNSLNEENYSLNINHKSQSLILGHRKNNAIENFNFNSIYNSTNNLNEPNKDINEKYFEEGRQNEVFFNNKESYQNYNHINMHSRTKNNLNHPSKPNNFNLLQKRNTCNLNFITESISSKGNNNDNKIILNPKETLASNLISMAESNNTDELEKLIEEQLHINLPTKKNPNLANSLLRLNKAALVENINKLKNPLIHKSTLKSISNSFRGLDDFVSNKDEILNIIEYNSESLTSLKLDLNFDDIFQFIKTLGRCRALQKLHLQFSSGTVNKFLSSFSLYRSFLITLDLLKDLKEFSTNPIVFIRDEIVEKLQNKKITYLNFRFPSYILTDLNEKFEIVKKFSLSFPHVTQLDIYFENIELSYNSKFSLMSIANEKEKEKNKAIIKNINLKERKINLSKLDKIYDSKPNSEETDKNETHKYEDVKSEINLNKNNSKNEFKDNININNMEFKNDVRMISNNKICDIISDEQKEKIKKLDKVLNDDFLQNGYFNMMFNHFKNLENLKVKIDGKKKIKFEELELESNNGLENKTNHLLVENKHLNNLKTENIKKKHSNGSLNENLNNEISEKKLKENKIKLTDNDNSKFKNDNLFQFYTTSKSNHTLITIKEAFPYNQDINNFCYVKNAFQVNKDKTETIQNNNSNKQLDYFMSEKKEYKLKIRSFSNTRTEIPSVNKNLGKKTSLENKNSAFDILNNKKDFPDLKQFYYIPYNKENESNIINKKLIIGKESNFIDVKRLPLYSKSTKQAKIPYNSSENTTKSFKYQNDFYTEDNLNINFKKNSYKENRTSQNKFTFLDKNDPSSFDRYGFLKYTSMHNLNSIKINKNNEKNLEEITNSNMKSCFFSTKNNSVKIFTKIGKIDSSKINFARANLKTPTLSSRICRPKGFLIDKNANQIPNNLNENRNIFTSREKIRNNLNSKLGYKSNNFDNSNKQILLDTDRADGNSIKENTYMDDSLTIINNNQNNNGDENPIDMLKNDVKSDPNKILENINFNLLNKQGSEISKVDINQIEDDIKKRDEEDNKNDLKNNFKLNNLEYSKKETNNIKKGLIIGSKYGRKLDSVIKTQNVQPKKVIHSTIHSGKQKESNQLIHDKKEKEIKENAEEIFFCEIMFRKLVISLLPCTNLKILEINLSSNINVDNLAENLYSFINDSKSIKRVKINLNCENEELTIREKVNFMKEYVFEFKGKKINEKILDIAKMLVTKNFSLNDPNNYNIIYKGSVKLFCEALISFKNLFFVNYLEELTLQHDEIDLKQAYSLREILEKATNLNSFNLKDLLLKCDFFEIISDKIHHNKFLRQIILSNIRDINEKSVNIFFKRLPCYNLSYLVLEEIDIGELFLSYISQVKNVFPKLLSFTFKPKRKLFHGISLLGQFFSNNSSLYEFKMSIGNVEDFYKLDEIITDYRFIKFDLD